MSKLAPIILFTYNRPWHTEQTLKALEQNELAADSILYIYADGAKENASEEQQQQIKEVRQLIRQPWGFKEIHIIEREKNWGLADNIVEGVTEIVNRYGKIVVLEDDIVTSKGFLKYMNDALTIYEDEERVMHVSGYMFPVRENLPSTFFYNTASCWGWGTWLRAWKSLNTNSLFLLRELYRKKINASFNLDGYANFISQLEANISKNIRTWAVKWYASFFLCGGYALHPYPSLVNNIGFDNSGENSGLLKDNNPFRWNKLANEILVKKLDVFSDEQARKVMKNFYKNIKFSNSIKNNNTLKRKIVGIIKLFAPPILTKIIRKVNYKKEVKNRDITTKSSELKRLSILPRYVNGSTLLLGKTVYFPDAASFLYMYNEICEGGLYKFGANTEQPYIIDGGANIGLASIYIKSLYPNAEIIAFEPDKNIFKTLSKNIESFGFSDIKLYQKALWSENTNLYFFEEGADAGRVSIKQDSYKIEAVSLGSFIHKPVDFLKIDVEGAEIEILKECEDKLHFVKKMFVEYHSFIEKSQDLATLLQLLEKHGFRYYLENPRHKEKQPFMHISKYGGIDLLVHIHATKE